MRREWVVVGKGPSGLLSASLLLSAGYDVTIVAHSQGSFPLWSGTLDFYSVDQQLTPVAHPGDHRDVLSRYLSYDQWLSGWDTWRHILASIGVETQVDAVGANLLSPTATGVLYPRYVVPGWQYACAVPGPVTVVSWQGIVDLDLESWAARYQLSSGLEAEIRYRPAPPSWSPRWTALHWAGFFDTEVGMAWLEHDLDEAAVGTNARYPLLLPQVIGIRGTEKILNRLSLALGRTVKEIPLVAPALGGIRIQERWQRFLVRQGVRLLTGEVIHVNNDGVRLADGRLLAGRTVLATGGVLGGGLRVNWDRTVVNTATGEVVLWSGNPEDLPVLSIGRDSASYDVVGRSSGNWNGDVHGGAGQTLGSVLKWWHSLQQEVSLAK